MIHPYRGVMPKVHPSAWIAGSADVIGDVELGDESSVWFSTVIRGDVHFVRVGRGSNLQDGAVVSPGTLVPRCSLLMGAPARVKRQVTEKDLELIYSSARNSVALAAEHRAAQDR